VVEGEIVAPAASVRRTRLDLGASRDGSRLRRVPGRGSGSTLAYGWLAAPWSLGTGTVWGDPLGRRRAGAASGATRSRCAIGRQARGGSIARRRSGKPKDLGSAGGDRTVGGPRCSRMDRGKHRHATGRTRRGPSRRLP